MAAVRINDEAAATAAKILQRHTLQQGGFAGAGGADDMHVLQTRPLIEADAIAFVIGAEGDGRVIARTLSHRVSLRQVGILGEKRTFDFAQERLGRVSWRTCHRST
jgi:hypothetical protein